MICIGNGRRLPLAGLINERLLSAQRTPKLPFRFWPTPAIGSYPKGSPWSESATRWVKRQILFWCPGNAVPVVRVGRLRLPVLFPDAEAREHRVQNVLHPDVTSNSPQCPHCQPQVLAAQFRQIGPFRSL